MRRDAVERCLQRIAGAARKLGDQAETYAPGMPWPQIRALGNVLRHDYDGVIHDLIAETVHRHLPPSREASVAAVARLETEERS